MLKFIRNNYIILRLLRKLVELCNIEPYKQKEKGVVAN